jgi:hypothetical protein
MLRYYAAQNLLCQLLSPPVISEPRALDNLNGFCIVTNKRVKVYRFCCLRWTSPDSKPPHRTFEVQTCAVSHAWYRQRAI